MHKRALYGSNWLGHFGWVWPFPRILGRCIHAGQAMIAIVGSCKNGESRYPGRYLAPNSLPTDCRIPAGHRLDADRAGGPIQSPAWIVTTNSCRECSVRRGWISTSGHRGAMPRCSRWPSTPSGDPSWTPWSCPAPPGPCPSGLGLAAWDWLDGFEETVDRHRDMVLDRLANVLDTPADPASGSGQARSGGLAPGVAGRPGPGGAA